MTAPDKSPCNARHINHVAIAVRDIDESLALYRRIFGLPEASVEELEDQDAIYVTRSKLYMGF